MTKSTNVEVIVERMISYMRTLSDAHNKTEIAGRIIELAERFAPSNQWFIQVLAPSEWTSGIVAWNSRRFFGDACFV